MGEKEIKVGIIGAGGIARHRHLDPNPNFRSKPNEDGVGTNALTSGEKALTIDTVYWSRNV